MIGNPGLGKSFSIPYHLWMFVRDGRTVVVHSSKRLTTWVFDKNNTRAQSVDDVKLVPIKIPEVHDKDTIFLWDPDEHQHSEPPEMDVGVIIIHSLTHSLTQP